MIWAAVVVAKDGNYEVTSRKVVGLFAALLILHGTLVRFSSCLLGRSQSPYDMGVKTPFLGLRKNCLATRYLAAFTKGFVFINLGATVSACQTSDLLASFCTKVTPVIIIVLLATTSHHDMHSATYVFGSDGIFNQTNGWNDGLAFLFGLLSVQWTVRGKFT
jgi:hypothetical protein